MAQHAAEKDAPRPAFDFDQVVNQGGRAVVIVGIAKGLVEVEPPKEKGKAPLRRTEWRYLVQATTAPRPFPNVAATWVREDELKVEGLKVGT